MSNMISLPSTSLHSSTIAEFVSEHRRCNISFEQMLSVAKIIYDSENEVNEVSVEWNRQETEL